MPIKNNKFLEFLRFNFIKMRLQSITQSIYSVWKTKYFLYSSRYLLGKSLRSCIFTEVYVLLVNIIILSFTKYWLNIFCEPSTTSSTYDSKFPVLMNILSRIKRQAINPNEKAFFYFILCIDFCFDGDWTQGLAHSRQALGRWASLTQERI